jgi:glycosyltransferase involved in cell wall biosynthesis
MIYVCVPTHNDAPTIGLVLWKVRQVFSSFPREYQLLVSDDASSDNTPEVLESYQRVLPLALTRHEQRQGWAGTVEALLREALRRSDRPKRDVAITLHPDFSVSPDALPELVRGIESGADLVVAERADLRGGFADRLVRRTAPWLLRPGVRLPGVRDPLSGVYAMRLSTLAYCLRQRERDLLEIAGPAAPAELVARTAAVARQIAVVPLPATAVLAPWNRRTPAFTLALNLFRAGRRLRVPAPTVEIRRPA